MTTVPVPARRAGRRAFVAAWTAPLRRLDAVLLGCVLALAGVGALLVWSASRSHLEQTGGDPAALLKRHLLNLALGLALGAVVVLVDYRHLRAFAPLVYAGAIVGLVLVLTPVGSTINGSHSWIVLGGGFQVQPSEFAKVGLVVCLALVLAQRPPLGRGRVAGVGPSPRSVLAALAVAGLPTALILLQPDLGTVLVLAAILIGMLTVGGVSLRWLVALALAGALTAGVAWQAELLEDYQVKRLTSFANPGADARGAGYTTVQSRIAIGSGGLVGKGLFHGAQTNGQFVPEAQTDFVFSVAGEELGLLGAGSILLLLGVVLWRAVSIAQRAEDGFGTLVAAGVVCWFAFQTFENVGMTIGIMPVTGLPLPFVSYGGSSMFANLLAIGLLQNIFARRYG